MPIFTRRRLQSMLDDLRPLIGDKSKENQILGRLKNKEPGPAIGAEMELALLWGIKQVASLEVEPEILGNRRPDAYSENLFETPAYIEVTALSDGNLSGVEKMHQAAHKIVLYANSIKKKSGNYLYFLFHEWSYYEEGKYNRELSVVSDFDLDETIKQKLKQWILIQQNNGIDVLYINSKKIRITIERKEKKLKQGSNYFSSLPPLAYDIEKNPLFARLKQKRKQLSGVPAGRLKVIFLADAGSTILKNIRENDITGNHFTGEEIIMHFLKRSSIDVVYVFTPKRTRKMFDDDVLEWQASHYINENYCKPTTVFDKILSLWPIFKKDIIHCSDKIVAMMRLLPKPRFEGYQARSLQQQGAFLPTNNKWFKGSSVTGYKDSLTMKISSRVLHEYLAGNDSYNIFLRNISSNSDNFFKQWLEKGFVIREISFEDGGVDEDDDHVLFKFEKDPSISPLK